MRQVIVPALAFALGIAVALLIHRTAFERPAGPHESVQPNAAVPAPAPQDRDASNLRAKAWQLAQGGHLREAQDKFLQLLALNPADADALRGLVAVRKSMGGGNPAALGRQAAEFDDAIRRGVETDEHYTRDAMKILLGATRQALEEVEGQATHGSARGGSATQPGQPPAPPAEYESRAAGKAAPRADAPAKAPPQTADLSRAVPSAPPSPPGRTTARRPSTGALREPETRPGPAGAGAAPPRSMPRTSGGQGHPSTGPTPPLPAAAPPAPAPSPAAGAISAPPAVATDVVPPPSPSSSVPLTGQNGALYVVRVGPISDRDRASSLVRQLADRGFPSTNLTSRLQYRVVSEPLPRNVAQGLASRLAGRGIQSTLQPLNSDTAQLLFGTFGSQKDADALSQRIAAQGYDAWVRERGTYALRVGPYPQAAIKTIADIVKSGAPEAAIAADPVPSQASLPAGAAAVPSSPPGSAAPRPPAASSPPAPAPRTPAPPPLAAPPVTPAPAPAASTPQPAPPPARPSPPQGSGYMVRVGPMPDADRASAIARQLAAGGFASATVAKGTVFRVVSEPLPRSAADRVVALLGGRGVHSKVEPVNGDTVQILFGSFGTQKEAEDLSQRISAQGYDAWVREATVYTVQVGPYPQSAVAAITGIVKSGAPDAAVTTEPVP